METGELSEMEEAIEIAREASTLHDELGEIDFLFVTQTFVTFRDLSSHGLRPFATFRDFS